MDAQIRRRFEPGGNSEISSYLQRLAEEIWRRSDLSGPIAVHVVRNQEHLAFSTLAGYIYVDEKLIRIAENESELAGALAHEIAHLAARHAAENITRMRLLEANPGWIATLLKPCRVFRAYLTTGGLNGFWRAVYCGNEIEADELATQYLWNSGFDPEGVLNLLVAIKDGEWVDLPAGPKREAWNAPVSLRQKRIRELLKRLPALDTPRLDSSDFAEVREHLRQSSLTRLSHR